MRYAFLIQLRLNVESQFALAGILRKLVFDNCDYREVVRLNCYLLVLDLYYKISPCET